jgi:hypothetical protein
LIERGAQGGTKSPAQPAALLLASLGGAMGPEERGQFAGFDVGKSTASAARLASWSRTRPPPVARARRPCWCCRSPPTPARPDPPPPTAPMAQGLTRAGLTADARAVVVEGLLALTLPSTPPTK